MKKRIQRLALSSLFVLSVGTVGAIIAEVSIGTSSAQAKCPACGTGLTCPGTPAGRCGCDSVSMTCYVKL